jgi:hypothetical protein
LNTSREDVCVCGGGVSPAHAAGCCTAASEAACQNALARAVCVSKLQQTRSSSPQCLYQPSWQTRHPHVVLYTC